MIFSTSLALLCLICIPWLIVINKKKSLSHLILMDHGMCYIAHVRKALEHLPQHRGMANAFLNGDQSFKEKMNTMQKIIAEDIVAIDECMTRHPLPITMTSRWQQIKNNWHSLKSDFNSISPNDSFERHTAMITDILSLISDSADDMRINAHPDNDLQKIATTTFNLLPTIIEVTGQARGIGTGAAAKGNVVTAVRIKLQFLHDRLTHTLATTQQTIENCLQGNNAQFDIKQQTTSNSFANTQLFLNSISQNMLVNEKPQISAEEYFSIGSKAFDSNIQLFDAISTALGEDLNHRIPRLKNKLRLSIIFSVIVLFSSLTIWQQLIFT